jgi:hypothetical protein
MNIWKLSTIYFTGKWTLIGETLNKLYYGAPEFTPVFRGVREARSLIFCVVISRSWFVQLSFFLTIAYLSFFDLPILITPLISSIISFNQHIHIWYLKLQGWIQGMGGVHPARATLKLEKIRFFCVKSWFFTRNTPKLFAPPSARRNFFSVHPLTWNPGSAPELYIARWVILAVTA